MTSRTSSHPRACTGRRCAREPIGRRGSRAARVLAGRAACVPAACGRGQASGVEAKVGAAALTPGEGCVSVGTAPSSANPVKRHPLARAATYGGEACPRACDPRAAAGESPVAHLPSLISLPLVVPRMPPLPPPSRPCPPTRCPPRCTTCRRWRARWPAFKTKPRHPANPPPTPPPPAPLGVRPAGGGGRGGLLSKPTLPVPPTPPNPPPSSPPRCTICRRWRGRWTCST